MIPEWLIIHHSETKDGQVKDWDAIKRYHMNVRGWSDIGYHYGIERIKGRVEIVVGRSESTAGAHCKQAGMNKKSLGVCVVGNYDKEAPPEDVWTALKSHLRALMNAYGIDRHHVLGHSEAQLLELPEALKTCPGKAFDMNRLRAELEDKNETDEAI